MNDDSDNTTFRQRRTIKNLLNFHTFLEVWVDYATKWLSLQKTSVNKRENALTMFFAFYLCNLKQFLTPKQLLEKEYIPPSLLEVLPKGEAIRNYDYISDFIDWLLVDMISLIDNERNNIITASFRNPFPRIQKQALMKRNLDSFSFKQVQEVKELIEINVCFIEWAELATNWLSSNKDRKESLKLRIRTLIKYFCVYLHEMGQHVPPNVFLNKNYNPPLLLPVLQKNVNKNLAITHHDLISDFINWIITENKTTCNNNGNNNISTQLRNPFPRIRKTISQKVDLDLNVLIVIDTNFEEWRSLGASWLKQQKFKKHLKKTIVSNFLLKYLYSQQMDLSPYALLRKDFTVPSLHDFYNHLGLSDTTTKYNYHIISTFIDWVIRGNHKRITNNGKKIPLSKLRNPFPQINRDQIRNFDPELRFLLDKDPSFELWRRIGSEWLAEQKINIRQKKAALTRFFISYLHKNRLNLSPLWLLDKRSSVPSLLEVLRTGSRTEETNKCIHDIISDLLEWTLKNRILSNTSGCTHQIPPHLRNPFPRLKSKILHKGSDNELRYILEFDPQLETWRSYAIEWLGEQANGYSEKKMSLHVFLVDYILAYNLHRDPKMFLRRDSPKPSIDNLIMDVMHENRSISDDKFRKMPKPPINPHRNNIIRCFIDWVLQEKLFKQKSGHYQIPDEFHNPFSQIVKRSGKKLFETNKNPLPFSYLKRLREMLSPGSNFEDWKWAQYAINSSGERGDWIIVDPSIIDKNDPDCVARKRVRFVKRLSRIEEVYEIWSPVRAVALYTALMMPLRTHQIRMLDSGESDTWRYEKGKWILNKYKLATGNEKNPIMKGVFHRGLNDRTDIYVNTNKTADINKDENDKGYIIPWTNDPVLYWLEKLRNWQQKYNPLKEATPWQALCVKHFNNARPNPLVLKQRGTCCFLFRNPADYDQPQTPITRNSLDTIWFKLLQELEKQCFELGETNDGERIRFIDPQNSNVTLYPLHSLRVSLITFYVENDIPIEIISKLIAGHSRVIMTYYYLKFGKAHINEKIEKAERSSIENERINYKKFLMEKTYKDFEEIFAYNNIDALNAASKIKSTLTILFEDKGFCPVGGKLCDEGGDIDENTIGKKKLKYNPVPGYPNEKNCIRCRFFMTGPGFMPGLTDYLNMVLYKIYESSNSYLRLQKQISDIEDERRTCYEQKIQFLKFKELERFYRIFETETQKRKNLVLDMMTSHRLLIRSAAIRSTDNNEIALVAQGKLQDIKYAFTETTELMQLEVLCENSVIYPEEEMRAPILRRTQIYDSMFQFNNRPPILFKLNPEQQFHACNDIIKIITARAGSLKGAVDLVEGNRLFSDIGLMDEMEKIANNKAEGIHLSNLIKENQKSLLT